MPPYISYLVKNLFLYLQREINFDGFTSLY